MEEIDEIQDLLNEINLQNIDLKDYQKLNIKELSAEIHKVIEMQYETLQRIEEFENQGTQPDLVKYVKMICKNSTERKISKIQKIYFEKMDAEYRNSR